MTEARNIIGKFLAPVSILVAGALACAFLKVDAYKEVSQELIALFGLIMAGVLPAMVLTASVLRAGNLSVKKLKAYRDALIVQLKVWIGLFIVSLISSCFVIFAKMISWTLPVTLYFNLDGTLSFSFDVMRILNGLITMSFVLLVVRAYVIGKGFISLLLLSYELASGEAQERDAARHRATDAMIAGLQERPDYGQYTEL